VQSHGMTGVVFSDLFYSMQIILVVIMLTAPALQTKLTIEFLCDNNGIGIFLKLLCYCRVLLTSNFYLK